MNVWRRSWLECAIIGNQHLLDGRKLTTAIPRKYPGILGFTCPLIEEVTQVAMFNLLPHKLESHSWHLSVWWGILLTLRQCWSIWQCLVHVLQKDAFQTFISNNWYIMLYHLVRIVLLRGKEHCTEFLFYQINPFYTVTWVCCSLPTFKGRNLENQEKYWDLWEQGALSVINVNILTIPGST